MHVFPTILLDISKVTVEGHPTFLQEALIEKTFYTELMLEEEDGLGGRWQLKGFCIFAKGRE